MMNKFFSIVLILLCFLISCKLQENRKNYKLMDAKGTEEEKVRQDSLAKINTTVQVIENVYNFGEITQGDSVEHLFYFKNTGNKPLVVEDARATCGCTVPVRPKEPIMPGDTSFIKVVFHSAGKKGDIEKQVTVIANTTPDFPHLVLEGKVNEKK